jgi:hypothetical protein
MAGPVYKTADAARAAATAARPSAFSQMSNVQGTGNLNAPNIWSDPENKYYKFAFATDPLAKAQAYQNLARALNNEPSAKPGFKNQFDYLNNLLSKSGLAKNELSTSAALDKIVTAAVGMNTDPLTFLEGYTPKGKEVKQPDTTTRFAKQIQTALQFKDIGDARQYYSDTYFKTWGFYPSSDLDKKFQDSWNQQVKDQDAPTTTKTTTQYAPIYDKKSKPVIDKETGKQKIDKFGNPEYAKIALDKSGQKRYTTITTGDTTSAGEGFTKEEQQQFLADFMVTNAPDAKWNVDNIGGSAKTLYDGIVAFSKANYIKVPDLVTLTPLIKNILSSPDAGVANEYLTQYKNTVRKQTASKYMSLAEYINAGEDAEKYTKPILETLSTALEKNFTIDDPFAMSVFNFKDDKGVYRMPNALELNNMIRNHPSFGQTAAAVNEAVDMSQNLRGKLGRG